MIFLSILSLYLPLDIGYIEKLNSIRNWLSFSISGNLEIVSTAFPPALILIRTNHSLNGDRIIRLALNNLTIQWTDQIDIKPTLRHYSIYWSYNHLKCWTVFVNCVIFNKEKEFSLINLVWTSKLCNLSNSHYKITVYKTEVEDKFLQDCISWW